MFKPAVKETAKLRLVIAGPSGSGKTYTGLAIAAALANGDKVAFVDTEHGSASKYADIFAFDVAEMHPPFHPDKFVAAINEAAAAGYSVVILDSLTHAWSGTGGVLDLVDEAAKRSRSGNTYMAWKEGTPVQNRLIDAIVGAPIHVIATMRSKTEYALVANTNGKQEPKKIGMAPEQRQGFEYEFDVALDMDIDNNAIVSKTRCPALTGRVFNKPGADVAGILATWLKGATPAPKAVEQGGASMTPTVVVAEQPTNRNDNRTTTGNGHSNGKSKASDGTVRRLHAVGVEFYGDKWDTERHRLVEAVTKGAATSSKELTEREAQTLISGMEKKLSERVPVADPFADMPERVSPSEYEPELEPA
jgi:hypothetical protein